MSIVRDGITMVCCFLTVTVVASAQTRKPGLWELTTTMTWQQSPFPAGTAGAPGGGVPHTTEVCFTQQMIDKYGAVLPQNRGCQVINVVKKSNSMTADMVCSGAMSGKGNLESSWTDGEHATGKIHFVGSMQVGPN